LRYFYAISQATFVLFQCKNSLPASKLEPLHLPLPQDLEKNALDYSAICALVDSGMHFAYMPDLMCLESVKYITSFFQMFVFSLLIFLIIFC